MVNGWKDVLPYSFLWSVWIFASQCIWERCSAKAFTKILLVKGFHNYEMGLHVPVDQQKRAEGLLPLAPNARTLWVEAETCRFIAG